jgi:very-short-patch-repair endonuclease
MVNKRARTFRSAPTSSELAAWRGLRLMRAEGVHVRRQHPIGRYIADFAVLKARLAIELDGSIHRLSAIEDAERDQALAQLGWNVLRIDAKMAFAPGAIQTSVRRRLIELGAYPIPAGWQGLPDSWTVSPPAAVGHPTPDAAHPTLPSRGG